MRLFSGRDEGAGNLIKSAIVVSLEEFRLTNLASLSVPVLTAQRSSPQIGAAEGVRVGVVVGAATNGRCVASLPRKALTPRKVTITRPATRILVSLLVRFIGAPPIH